MAQDVNQVYSLAEDLLEPSQKKAKEEIKEIKSFAKEQSGLAEEDFKQWDLPFWAKRLQEKKFSYTEEELKPYFSYEKVCKGLFDLAHNLFGITVEEVTENTPEVWDQHVKFYNVFDENRKLIASFYLDPYARPHNKRGGVMDERLHHAPSYSRRYCRKTCCLPYLQLHSSNRKHPFPTHF